MVDDSLVILMAIYNGEKYLRAQLDSLLQQDFERFTVLIRDDGSIDGTLDVIADYCMQFPDKILQVEDQLGNLGSSKCFMNLLENTENYEYVMFCDQDDVWLPDKVSTALFKIKAMEKSYTKDTPLMCFTDLKVVDENLNIIHESFWKSQRLTPVISENWQCILAQNVVTGCTMILNQAARQVSLPFKMPEMVHDQWIAVNVAKYGHVSFLQEAHILYRQHSHNVVGAHANMFRYLLGKMGRLYEVISFYKRASKFFGDISASRLLMIKLRLNLRRFW